MVKSKKSNQRNSLISVIVPAYNVEKFIGKCLESILAQTYENFELIVIDDGSTDFTADILAHFSKLDRRIKVLSEENEGVSAARNIGLDTAQGEYIMFVDADDYIEPDTLEKTLTHIQKNDADVCIFYHQAVFWKDGKKCTNVFYPMLHFNGVFFDAPEDFFKQMPVVWEKLFKNNGLLPRFNETLKKAEDGAFWWEYCLKNPKIVSLNKICYNYVQHAKNTVKKEELLKRYDIIHSAEYVANLSSFKSAPKAIKAQILNRYAASVLYESAHFFASKRWPKNYRKAIYYFLMRHYTSELSVMDSYDKLRKLYLKQLFHFINKIYHKELKGDVLTTTILGFNFKKKVTLKEVEDFYIKKFKANKDKYEHDTYILSDALYEQAECIDAYALFLYMRERGMKAYYVILKSNPLYDRLLREGNIENIIALPDTTKKVCYYSFLYDILLHTKAIISSFGGDAINQEFLTKEAHWKYIFIQHGKTFLKESVFTIGYLQKYQYMVVSSNSEKKLFSKYEPPIEHFIKGGQARWDLLSQKSTKKKKILIMFTWRHVAKEKFNQTQYKKKILSILQNKELDAYLKKRGIKLYFALHHELLAKGIDFKTSYKHLVPMDKISEYVKECSLLITDFSSVAFDFMFQNKPVLFYLLDKNDKNLHRYDKEDMAGMSYKKYLIGNVFYSWDDTFEKLKYYIKHHFALEKDLKEKYAKFFYFKKDIRKHLTDEIEKICKEK